MKYKLFIEENFLVDNAKTGKLQLFTFNPVQVQYYEDLVRDYDIERKGIVNARIRENILKARREGFSSLILGLFAADDIMQDNPTETDVLSYKADATDIFRKRYRTYLLSAALIDQGYKPEDIASNVNLLEEIAPHFLSVDATDIEIASNKAHFQSHTAGARVGGRGGVVHKLLFSEVAFYQDTAKIRAAEMVQATSQQVDEAAGAIFMESTENGVGTFQHQTWQKSKRGQSSYKNRFYGTGHFYTLEQLDRIKSGYVDMDAYRRDYPATEDDLFKGSAKNFTSDSQLQELIGSDNAQKELVHWTELRGDNYIDQAEILKHELELLERTHKSHALYIGLDTAKIIDATIATALKDRRVDLNGGIKCVAIDVTNGDFMADWFERNTKWYILRVKFSRPSKSLMFTNLQVIMADKLTQLPVVKVGETWVSDEARHFYEQMQNLEKEHLGSLLVVHHPPGSCNPDDHNYDECVYHDDYPDSWCLAEHAYSEINGAPVHEKKPEALTVPNSIQRLLGKPFTNKGRYQSDEYA